MNFPIIINIGNLLNKIRVKQSYLEFALIGFFTLIAFFLRVYNLGHLGFTGDEELTALAARGILDHGYPSMPSGMPYLRSLPFSYLVVFSVNIFGESEFAERLPSVIFGTLKIPLIYIFCKKLLNREVAIIAAFLLSFAVWDIQVSRLARMYSMFAFFYLLSLYAFYRGYLERGRRNIYLWLTPLIFLFTCVTHSLGLFIVFLFLCPLLVHNYNVVKKRTLVCLFFITGIVGYVIKMMMHKPYATQRHMGAELVQAKSGIDDIVISHNLWQEVLHQFPHILFSSRDLIKHLIHFHPNIFGFLVFLSVFGVVILIFKKVRGFDSRSNILFSVALIISVFLQVYGMAAIIMLGYFYKNGKGLNSFFDKQVMMWVVLLPITFVFWFIYGLFIWQGYGYETSETIDIIRKTVKSLLFFPPIDVRTFVFAFPKMTILVVVALSMFLYKFMIDKSTSNLYFLVFSFIVPLMLSGFMQEWTRPRYSFHLYPIFIIFFSWIIYKITLALINIISKLVKRFTGNLEIFTILDGKYNMVTSLIVVIPLLYFTVDLNRIKQAYAVSNFAYGDNTYSQLGGRNSYPDHKGTGLYVKKNLKDNDIVIAIDLYQQAYYVGRVDYRIKGWNAKMDVEDRGGLNIYTKSKTIHDLSKLLKVLNEANGRIWIITENEMLPETRELFVDKAIEKFLEANNLNVVYRGRDRKTKVYLFNEDRL